MAVSVVNLTESKITSEMGPWECLWGSDLFSCYLRSEDLPTVAVGVVSWLGPCRKHMEEGS